MKAKISEVALHVPSPLLLSLKRISDQIPVTEEENDSFPIGYRRRTGVIGLGIKLVGKPVSSGKISASRLPLPENLSGKAVQAQSHQITLLLTRIGTRCNGGKKNSTGINDRCCRGRTGQGTFPSYAFIGSEFLGKRTFLTLGTIVVRTSPICPCA